MIKLTDQQKFALNVIRRHYGDEPQLYKAVEELRELLSALLDYLQFKNAEKPEVLQDLECDVIEEMADVYVMLEHLMNVMDASEDYIYALIDYKLNRQIDRMAVELERELGD